MSWLHCMWGVGATLGPYIMGAVLAGGALWNTGYRIISVLQVVLTAIPGAKAIMICFFCYCAIEQTAMLWVSSYLNLAKGALQQSSTESLGGV